MRGTPSWVTKLRRELPSVQRQAYLNTGTAGPLPRSTVNAIRAEVTKELRAGRANFARFGRFLELRERTRMLVATLLGADADEVALTHHTSDGVNIVLWGTSWHAGDVVVTTTLEHDAVTVPMALLNQRRGVEIRFADIGRGERALEGLHAALDERVRLVILSHIVWSSGAMMPVRELVEAAHDVGALVLIDGAQSAGVLPVDVRDLDVDYYTVSGQKWLCGPEGTGALFVRRDKISALLPTFGSYFTASSDDMRGRIELHDSARRYEVGMVFRPSLAGFAASLDWMLHTVDVERAWTRSTELATHCREALTDLDAVDLTPAEQAGPLVAVDLPEWSPAQLHALADHLSLRGVVVRSIDKPPYALRASFGFFNTLADVEAFVTGLGEAIDDGPDALPIEGWASKLPTER